MKPKTPTTLSKRDIAIICRAIHAADMMAGILWNARQDPDIPGRYRKYMRETGSAYDLARRDFTKRLLKLINRQ